MCIKNVFAALCLLSAGCLIATAATAAHAATYLGPTAVAVAKDARTLYVAEMDARQLAFVDVTERRVVATIDLPGEPTAVVVSPDGSRLYVPCAAVKSTVCVIDVGARKVLATLAVGHTATGAAITPDGKRLYVCNRFNNDVSVLDLAAGKELARVPVIREPHGAVATPDGKSVFVSNLLPLDAADSYNVAAAITVIDTASNHTTTIRLPNGSSSVRGLCISPDGKYVYAVHILSRYQMPTTQLERGWMNTNALSIIDVAAKKPLNTVLLDDVDLGAANPWGVAVSADGKLLCVSHAGTRELSAIDVPALLEKLSRVSAGDKKEASASGYGAAAATTAADVPNDLAFLVGLRRRIQLPGDGPRGLALLGSTAYVAEYFSDSLAAVDTDAKSLAPVAQIALGPKPQLSVARRGEMLFNDAEICFQHWQSCESCHPDARVDGLNWDLLNDGLGNPKNTKSMLLAHRTPPSMWLGVRDGAEVAVRSGITHILFAVRPEEEALAMDAYLKALQPVPSPHLVDGKLSPAAERGKQLFTDAKIGCSHCHSEPLYTDLRRHDVGSRGKFDAPSDRFVTPSLVEVWRTAPYMHDGQHTTIKDVLVKGKHGRHGDAMEKLTEAQLNDLIEYVLSL
jgi:YVTN family beta-propeller protein